MEPTSSPEYYGNQDAVIAGSVVSAAVVVAAVVAVAIVTPLVIRHIHKHRNGQGAEPVGISLETYP